MTRPDGMTPGWWRAAVLVRDPGTLPAPQPPPDEVRRAAREIVSRPEFRPPPRTVTQVIYDWITRNLDRLTTGTGGGTRAGIVVAVLAIGLIVFLIVRFARTVQRDPGRGVVVDNDTGRSATDWDVEAAEHESAGRWRDAVRCRYRALVAELAASGIVQEIPGRTAGEYRAEVRSALPSAADSFAEASELFERAWYSSRPTGADDAARVRQLAGDVKARIARVPAGVA